MPRIAAFATIAALLLASACSSSDGSAPVHHLAALKKLLVTLDDVDLAGYRAMTPNGEEQAHTATAITYFTAASGFRQVTVTLVATPNASAAQAAVSAAQSTAAQSLRSLTRSRAVAFGRHGRELAGRTKGDGALQDSIYFVEGAVAVTVTLSSSTPDQPADLATAVAQAQDAKLRRAG